ncbi:MAG: McrB family protein [Desulfosalsimonas sp.]
MPDNQSFPITPFWQEKLKKFYSEHVPEQRIQVRLQGEQEARDLLEQKLGQLDQTDLKAFLEALNKDWWEGKVKKDRFMPFYGDLAHKTVDSMDAFNKWTKRLWEADDNRVDQVLDEFWQKNEVAGAGTSLPTAILYLRDPEKSAIWVPSLEMGLKAISAFTLGKRRTAAGYKQFNQQLQNLRTTLGFPPQIMDILLSLASKEAMPDKYSFESLFQEFLTTYLDTPEGQEHLKNYQLHRQEGKDNYKELVAKQQKGEDITDFLLLKCLPYNDTQSNLAKGAWAHLAPCITGNIKQWFENAGWASPDDWPVIAETIFAFYEQCFKNFEKLDEHCRVFLESCPAKGFQMGMLTPFLNAIDPEHYAIVNNKSRRVINYLTKNAFTNNLADYPKINEAIFRFAQNKKEMFAEVTEKNVLPLDIFDQFCHWMVAIKKFNFKETQIYKIAPGENAKRWEEWLANGYASIGWEALGDLSDLSKKDFEKKKNQVLAEHADWTQKALNQVWQFANIKEGDRVVANKGKKEIIGMGTVIGPYYFVPNTEHGHRLPVIWEDLTRRRVDEPSWGSTLQKIKPDRFEEIISTSVTVIEGATDPQREISDRNPPYSISNCAQDIGFAEADLECWINGINRKQQAVIYGPPGTGKTYVANLIADHLIGGGNGFKKLIQFHPEYAYQDFMQGIRPKTKDGTLRYEMIPGVFYKFCQAAEDCGDATCVLIIDEINRANLSRVFGELMYLLEYRNASVDLPGGGTFAIPHNVRIIGTMNTADRSIALVDYALRRRFAFLRLAPKYEILVKFHEETGFATDKLIQILQEINNQIDDANYELGISFFLTENLDDQIEDIWKMEIEPYLEEYFFDDREKAEMFSWKRIQSRLQ